MKSLQEGKPVLSNESVDAVNDLRKGHSGGDDASNHARNMGGVSLHGDTVRAPSFYLGPSTWHPCWTAQHPSLHKIPFQYILVFLADANLEVELASKCLGSACRPLSLHGDTERSRPFHPASLLERSASFSYHIYSPCTCL